MSRCRAGPAGMSSAVMREMMRGRFAHYVQNGRVYRDARIKMRDLRVRPFAFQWGWFVRRRDSPRKIAAKSSFVSTGFERIARIPNLSARV